MKYFLVLMVGFTSVLMAKPKFTDQQIAAMTPQYFKRNHSAPKLTGLKIYKDGGDRVYHIEIMADRNRSSDDLSFAVSALANMGQYAKKPFKNMLWLCITMSEVKVQIFAKLMRGVQPII